MPTLALYAVLQPAMDSAPIQEARAALDGMDEAAERFVKLIAHYQAHPVGDNSDKQFLATAREESERANAKWNSVHAVVVATLSQWYDELRNEVQERN